MWLPPASIAVAVVMPETVTGVALSAERPSPSSPLTPLPQQRTVLLARRTQVWAFPAVTAVAVVMPGTVTGASRWVVVPSPSCLALL